MNACAYVCDPDNAVDLKIRKSLQIYLRPPHF